MISNTGVVVFAGTAVSYLLNPAKYSPLVALYGILVLGNLLRPGGDFCPARGLFMDTPTLESLHGYTLSPHPPPIDNHD